MPTFAFKHPNKQLNESTKNQSHNTKKPADLTQSSARPCRALSQRLSRAVRLYILGWGCWKGWLDALWPALGQIRRQFPKTWFPAAPVSRGWRPLRNTKETPLAQSWENTELEVSHGAKRGFSFPVGLTRTAGEANASDPSLSALSKGRRAPPGEAAEGKGEPWTVWREMPNASFLVRHVVVPKLCTIPPGASWAVFDTPHSYQFGVFAPGWYFLSVATGLSHM